MLLDRTPHSVLRTASLGDDVYAFEWTWPTHLVGGSLDVVAVETGRSVLDQEIDLARLRNLRWGGWALRGRRVTGQFALEGEAPAPDLAIPVEFVSEGALFGRCFAEAISARHYRFSGEVMRLPPPGGFVEITPRIGALPIDARLRVPSSAFDCAGCLDPAEGTRAQGWAVDLRHPKRRLQLELRINGHVVATALADQMREDVRAEGLSDGHCGFVIPFPDSVPRDRPVLVEVTVAPNGPNLCNSPYLRPALPPYAGFFDGLNGGYADGWAIDMHQPGRKLVVEAVCGGEVIGTAVAELHRGDVEHAGLPSPGCGFHLLLDRPPIELLGRDVVVRIAGTDRVLPGSPRQVALNPNLARFLGRGDALRPDTSARLRRSITHRTHDLRISIIMPVFETRREWLAEALESVRRQWSANWELICVDDGSRAPHVQELLAAYARADKRIRVLRAPANLGIARAVNLGLRAASGEYVAFMDHDDALEPDAIHHLAETARRTGADLLYSDEVLTGQDLNAVIEVRARPAFSHDFYLSHPYFAHMVCIRTALAQALTGYDERMAISADVDFVLRAVERAAAVAHVPRVLYRWRTHGGSAGHAKRPEVMSATRSALERHLRRLGSPAEVSEGLGYNQFRIDWPDDGGEVLIVIPTKNRVDLLKRCIDSIERTAPGENIRIVIIDHQSTDPKTRRYLAAIGGRHRVMPYEGPFNYGRMNNQAVRRHGARARYLLFMNNDVEALAQGWLGRLRALAGRKQVGVVGPLLLYGNQRVQHAGVLVGFNGAADHAMKLAQAYGADGRREPGYNCNLTSVRDYSAVTAACMMMRRDVFRAVRGFDERFAVGFNDTDLCLRVRAAGFKVLYDGHTVLHHHESATRIGSAHLHHPEDDERLRARWARYFDGVDPFYSPLLSPRGIDHVLRTDEGCKGRMSARVVQLGPGPGGAPDQPVAWPSTARRGPPSRAAVPPAQAGSVALSRMSRSSTAG